MISLAPSTKVFLACRPVDLRRVMCWTGHVVATLHAVLLVATLTLLAGTAAVPWIMPRTRPR